MTRLLAQSLYFFLLFPLRDLIFVIWSELCICFIKYAPAFNHRFCSIMLKLFICCCRFWLSLFQFSLHIVHRGNHISNFFFILSIPFFSLFKFALRILPACVYQFRHNFFFKFLLWYFIEFFLFSANFSSKVIHSCKYFFFLIQHDFGMSMEYVAFCYHIDMRIFSVTLSKISAVRCHRINFQPNIRWIQEASSKPLTKHIANHRRKIIDIRV